MAEIKIYGKVKLIKMKCSICYENSLGERCCGKLKFHGEESISSVKRIAGKPDRRNFSRIKLRKKIEEQDGKCFWCACDFRTEIYFTRKLKIRKVFPIADHLKPYCYDQDTSKYRCFLQSM